MRLSVIKGLLALITGGMLATGIAAQASSPDAWEQHRKEVTASCIRTSGLRNAKLVGEIISFGDQIGYDILLVKGNYPQPMMNHQIGQFLCLSDRKSRQAYTSEANDFLPPRDDRASGVPGQPIDQVLRWATNHPFLLPLKPVQKLDPGYPAYQSVISLGQKPNQSASYIDFQVYTDANRRVTSSAINYRDYSQIRRPLAFTRQDPEGLQLIQTIYGEAIQADFRRSRQVRDEGWLCRKDLKVTNELSRSYCFKQLLQKFY